MFHISRKLYLEYDFMFAPTYPSLLVSERWATSPMADDTDLDGDVVPSLDVLLTEKFDGKLEKFWEYVLNKDDKFIVYIEPETMIRLQVQYWKSIFERPPTPEDIHFLYTTYVESVRLMAYFKIHGHWDPRHDDWVRTNVLSEVEQLSLEEITEIYEEMPFSPAIAHVDKRSLSIEYLMMDFFADRKTPYKEELLRRVKAMSWDNWMDELEHLKYEILSGTINVDRLDPNIDTSVGNVEEQLKKSDLLSWTVDPMFNEDVEYIRAAYDYKIFYPCWYGVASIWGEGFEDMSELNELINNDRYEELLMKDVERGFACAYTRTRFLNKANQTLAAWCYDRVRNGKSKELAKFKLPR